MPHSNYDETEGPMLQIDVLRDQLYEDFHDEMQGGEAKALSRYMRTALMMQTLMPDFGLSHIFTLVNLMLTQAIYHQHKDQHPTLCTARSVELGQADTLLKAAQTLHGKGLATPEHWMK